MKNAGSIVDVIKKLQVTEKGTALTEKQNKHLFRVNPSANKQAVEKIYNVKVDKVNTMNYAGKWKRQRSLRYGKTADWKRAVVTLKEGSKIEIA